MCHFMEESDAQFDREKTIALRNGAQAKERLGRKKVALRRRLKMLSRTKIKPR